MSEGSTVTPVSRRPSQAEAKGLGTALYDLLKERLCEGAFQAGERIAVDALRAEYDVSKQPIMQALHQLANDGLVTITPQVGCRVATYSPQEVRDFFVMFGAFEGAIAATAAQRRTPEQIPSLREICRATAELESLREPQERTHGYLVLNRKFHRTIHDMAHSPIMADRSRRMWDLSDLMIATTGTPFPLHTRLSERNSDHMRVVDAIEAQDADVARQEMETHIVETIALIQGGSPEGRTMDLGAGMAREN